MEKEKARLENAGVVSRLPAVRQRQSDIATLSKVMSILEGTEGPSQTSQKLTLLLRYANTVNNILVRSTVPRSGSAVIEPVNMGRSRATLDCGASSECVTMVESIEKRRQKEASHLRNKREKEQQQERKRPEAVERAAVKAREILAKKECARERARVKTLARQTAAIYSLEMRRRQGVHKRDQSGGRKRRPALDAFEVAASLVLRSVSTASSTSDSVRN